MYVSMLFSFLIERLMQLFGLTRVLWLEHGHLEVDDTER